MIRTFTDDLKQTHTLDLDSVQVDGVQCIGVQATGQFVQFETMQGITITCDLVQFWHEVAGPDLNAQEAGLLLAECLMRQVVIGRTSASLHEALSLLTRATALSAEIPTLRWVTTRLDPLARQAMLSYDGSEAMTNMLARILQRDSATIQTWAQQLGLDVPAPDRAPEPLPTKDEDPFAETCPRFRWSPERLQRLEQVLSTCSGRTVIERAQQVADRCGWPVEKVRSKLYEMSSLSHSRPESNPTAREIEHVEAEQEGDQRVEPHTALV